MGKRILITGAGGYLGMRVAIRLAESPSIERIVGLDIRPPRDTPNKFIFLRRDIREPLTEILKEHAIDSILHLAYVKEQIHDTALMEDINVNGLRNVLRSAAAANAKQILYTSSASVYGFHPDNPNPLLEDHPLRANEDYVYNRNKEESETLIGEFSKEHPDIKMTVIRPVFVVGKGFDDPLSRHLLHPVVLMPTKSASLQFVHEDDLAEIISILLEREIAGTYNVGSEGTLTFPEMADILGHKKFFIPFWLFYWGNAIAWALRMKSLSESPSSGLLGVRYDWIVSSEKLKRATSFRYRYSSREAFEDWARHAKHRASQSGSDSR